MGGLFGVLLGWLGLGAAGIFGASAAAGALGDVFVFVERILDRFSWPIIIVLLFYWSMRIRIWRDK